MTGWNLPPGVTDADIDRAAGADEYRAVCRCGHEAEAHGPDSPFDDGCYECDCEAFEERDYPLSDPREYEHEQRIEAAIATVERTLAEYEEGF